MRAFFEWDADGVNARGTYRKAFAETTAIVAPAKAAAHNRRPL
jgi:hypothetical protein